MDFSKDSRLKFRVNSRPYKYLIVGLLMNKRKRGGGVNQRMAKDNRGLDLSKDDRLW